jgi:hypothetical protein
MRVYGIHFTSTPCRHRPLRVALCRFDGDRLSLDALCAFESAECFHNLLRSDGPWVAGLDFPFGLPRGFVRPQSWPPEWRGYVSAAARLDRGAFRALARRAAAHRQGAACVRRAADRALRAVGPARAARPPVGLLFHAGAPALLHAGVTAVPMHAGDPQRVAVEAYPRLVARALVGHGIYRDATPGGAHDACRASRAALLGTLAADDLYRHYGLELEGLAAYRADLLQEPSGAALDAVMCAVQAAWAWSRREEDFGVPRHADSREGWIADPATADRGARATS